MKKQLEREESAGWESSSFFFQLSRQSSSGHDRFHFSSLSQPIVSRAEDDRDDR